jgi:hypothetical protein
MCVEVRNRVLGALEAMVKQRAVCALFLLWRLCADRLGEILCRGLGDKKEIGRMMLVMIVMMIVVGCS